MLIICTYIIALSIVSIGRLADARGAQYILVFLTAAILLGACIVGTWIVERCFGLNFPFVEVVYHAFGVYHIFTLDLLIKALRTEEDADDASEQD